MNAPVHTLARDSETPVRTFRAGGFSLRCAYARSADTRDAGESGQDYLTFRCDDRALAFALCDGVSQSFYGEIAAVFLGDALRDWLWQGLPRVPLDGPLLEGALHALLFRLAAPASDLVQNYQLPRGTAPYLTSILEEKRRIGSETCFLCGRVDLAGPAHPAGRLILAWAGDCRCRLWTGAAERTALLGTLSAGGLRWCTSSGLVGGPPGWYMSPLSDLGAPLRIAAYTDGLASLDLQPAWPSDSELQAIIRRAGADPRSDDIAFMEIQQNDGMYLI